MIRESGKYVGASTTGESYQAFVPHPLPPSPPLQLTPKLFRACSDAMLALGRLDLVATLLPNNDLFIYMYVRKEAILSSQIEGTQSSLSNLLLFEIEEAPGVPFDDVIEVSNYVKAMNHGLSRIRSGYPLTLNLIKKMHGILLSEGRGKDKDPGNFRRSQNWVGGSKASNAEYVPPPASEMLACLDSFEKFIHDDSFDFDVLIQAALLHVQFESIHPFHDGNGRVGRLLITLLLCQAGILKEPLLYLSLYFKNHRKQYYRLLQNVRDNGEWEDWVEFFVEGVRLTSEQAVETAGKIRELFASDESRIKGVSSRITGSALNVLNAFMRYPLSQSNKIVDHTSLSPTAVNNSIKLLEELNIVAEITGKKRYRVYAYTEYIRILEEGTKLL